MSADVDELRELLHRAVDLACDILERADRPRRAPAPDAAHDVNDVDRAFAQRELARHGWLPKRAGGKR